eukprot:Clim_evm50s152 gene=Clim_evmTU50s152
MEVIDLLDHVYRSDSCVQVLFANKWYRDQTCIIFIYESSIQVYEYPSLDLVAEVLHEIRTPLAAVLIDTATGTVTAQRSRRLALISDEHLMIWEQVATGTLQLYTYYQLGRTIDWCFSINTAAIVSRPESENLIFLVSDGSVQFAILRLSLKSNSVFEIIRGPTDEQVGGGCPTSPMKWDLMLTSYTQNVAVLGVVSLGPCVVELFQVVVDLNVDATVIPASPDPRSRPLGILESVSFHQDLAPAVINFEDTVQVFVAGGSTFLLCRTPKQSPMATFKRRKTSARSCGRFGHLPYSLSGPSLTDLRPITGFFRLLGEEVCIIATGVTDCLVLVKFIVKYVGQSSFLQEAHRWHVQDSFLRTSLETTTAERGQEHLREAVVDGKGNVILLTGVNEVSVLVLHEGMTVLEDSPKLLPYAPHPGPFALVTCHIDEGSKKPRLGCPQKAVIAVEGQDCVFLAKSAAFTVEMEWIDASCAAVKSMWTFPTSNFSGLLLSFHGGTRVFNIVPENNAAGSIADVLHFSNDQLGLGFSRNVETLWAGALATDIICQVTQRSIQMVQLAQNSIDEEGLSAQNFLPYTLQDAERIFLASGDHSDIHREGLAIILVASSGTPKMIAVRPPSVGQLVPVVTPIHIPLSIVHRLPKISCMSIVTGNSHTTVYLASYDREIMRLKINPSTDTAEKFCIWRVQGVPNSLKPFIRKGAEKQEDNVMIGFRDGRVDTFRFRCEQYEDRNNFDMISEPCGCPVAHNTHVIGKGPVTLVRAPMGPILAISDDTYLIPEPESTIWIQTRIQTMRVCAVLSSEHKLYPNGFISVDVDGKLRLRRIQTHSLWQKIPLWNLTKSQTLSAHLQSCSTVANEYSYVTLTLPDSMNLGHHKSQPGEYKIGHDADENCQYIEQIGSSTEHIHEGTGIDSEQFKVSEHERLIVDKSQIYCHRKKIVSLPMAQFLTSLQNEVVRSSRLWALRIRSFYRIALEPPVDRPLFVSALLHFVWEMDHVHQYLLMHKALSAMPKECRQTIQRIPFAELVTEVYLTLQHSPDSATGQDQAQ